MSLRSMFAQAHEDAKAIREKFEGSKFFKAWRERKNTVDKNAARNGVFVANTMFLWVANTSLYTHLAYILPYIFSEYDPWTIYYIKVFVCFCYVQAMANWICAKCYGSAYKVTKDRPEVNKTLWDNHDSHYSVMIPMHNGNCNLNGDVNDSDLHVEKKNLSWKWCDECKCQSPPRSHHCRLCKTCILKRDHHCFILGTCIGYYNQRYFIILSFYLTLVSWPAMYMTYIYLNDHFAAGHNSHYFLPVAAYQYLWNGTMPFHIFCMISYMNLMWIGGGFGTGFFSAQLVLLYNGKTAYEFLKDIKVKSTASISSHLRSVFGDFWFVNFFFPAVLLYRQSGDGTVWDSMRTY